VTQVPTGLAAAPDTVHAWSANTGGIIYAVVDASIVEATFDSNTPNGTTSGPPASFEKP
jgi:hypothetical protein